ncbi:MAG: glycoside hydrolase family 130 protein [Puniceicoccaceae bacterium]
MKVKRYERNPIITPAGVKPSREDFEVVCVFNCGVIRFEGDVLLLMRVAEIAKSDDENVARVPLYDEEFGEIIIKDFNKNDPDVDTETDSRYVLTTNRRYLSSISHFRIARSKDGINFDIADSPCMTADNMVEMYGIEDPRITEIAGTYYINYSAISPVTGVTTCLASTKDFKTFERHGIIFTPDNKDIAIFPGKINGKYYALHRPASAEYEFRDIWIAESSDLIHWGKHRSIIQTRPDYWDNGRIGCSAVPFLTDAGWIEVYHGSSKDNRYCLGISIHDKDDPSWVLARSEVPLMEPETDYELNGFFGNVIFNCGVLFEDDVVKIYYGAADEVICYAEISLDGILESVK